MYHWAPPMCLGLTAWLTVHWFSNNGKQIVSATTKKNTAAFLRPPLWVDARRTGFFLLPSSSLWLTFALCWSRLPSPIAPLCCSGANLCPYLSVRSLTNWHWKVLLTCFERAVVHLISPEAFTWDCPIDHFLQQGRERGQVKWVRLRKTNTAGSHMYIAAYKLYMYVCISVRASRDRGQEA